MKFMRTRFTAVGLLLLLFFTASSLQGQSIFINEFMASNVAAHPDIVDFDAYPDWIELHNAGNNAVDIGGFYLTDNLGRPDKWRVPDGTIISGKGFLRIWADGEDRIAGSAWHDDHQPTRDFTVQAHHTNFKLSIGGEEIGLYDPNGLLIDSVVFGLQLPDVSFGRVTDGAAQWGYFGECTPGASNATPVSADLTQTDPPVFSLAGGLYKGTISVSLQAPSAADIYYTLDGTRPGTSSSHYNGPLPVSEPLVIRAVAYESGKIISPVATQSYIVNRAETLPVLSLAFDPATVLDSEQGIFGIPMKSREVPAHVSLFHQEDHRSLSQDAGMRLSGQASWMYAQKPFTLAAKDRFGSETFNAPVFVNRDISQYRQLYLRNSGTPDNLRTLFRDALQHSLIINQMDVDCQAYQPVSTYFNGRYWGIYNLRDKIDGNYLAGLHGIDPDNIDLLEYDFNPEIVEIEGNSDHFDALMDYLENNSLESDENYRHVTDQIDIDSYIDYLIAEIFCANVNWLNTNVKFWRERRPGGKYRFILLDLDWGFGLDWNNFSSPPDHNTLEMAVSTPGSFLDGWEWATLLFRRLLENDNFSNAFCNRYLMRLQTTLSRSRCSSVLDSLTNRLRPEMQRHIDRWIDADQGYAGEPPIPDMAFWLGEVQKMKNFASQRSAIQMEQLRSFLGKSYPVDFTLQVENSERGSVLIQNVPVPAGFAGKAFPDSPIEFKAVPQPGYVFSHWSGASTSTSPEITLAIAGNEILTAHFETSDASLLQGVLAADTRLTAAQSPYFVLSTLTVPESYTLTVDAGVVINMAQGASLLVNGGLQIEGSASSPVLIQADANTGAEAWGAIVLDNTSEPCALSHLILKQATHGPDAEKQVGAISSDHSDVIMTGIHIDDAPFPIIARYGNVEITHSNLHSEHICDFINIKYAESALVANCTLRGNMATDTDAIDYDGIESGVIRDNVIYNFTGYNSDAIDLGEEATGIQVHGNIIFNINDKGVSVGQASTGLIRNNIFVNCGQGVGVKDIGSMADIRQCTFYGCKIGVASFEKNYGAGGGTVLLNSSLILHSTEQAVWVDNLSRLSTSYSLSDTKTLDGVGNVRASINLYNNFYLPPASPAIDSGDPSLTDADGSRADMGALPFTGQAEQPLFINEFLPVALSGSQYVEIFNRGGSAIDISGYSLKGSVNHIFASGTVLDAGACLLLASDGSAFQHGITWTDGGLSPYENDFRLYNSADALIDHVTWSLNEDMPFINQGHSLCLRADADENLYLGNWRSSLMPGGTPGKSNELPMLNKLYINEVMAVNEGFIADENGDYNDWIEIYNGNDFAVDLGGLYISDNPDNLTKYRFNGSDSKATTLPAHGYALVWADESSSEGVLHTNFKLTGTGESLVLVQVLNSDTLKIDEMSFGELQPNHSWTRSDDGSSSWKETALPTPLKPNSKPHAFKKGILVFNGISPLYGVERDSAFANNIFWGAFEFEFWDFFDAPPYGYPGNMPEPVGHGMLPVDVLEEYSTVIWLGNYYGGDNDAWANLDMLSYLEEGGNVLLLTRLAERFITGDLLDYLGVVWSDEIGAQGIQNAVSMMSGLRSMSAWNVNGYLTNTYATPMEMETTRDETTLLFKDLVTFEGVRALGAWRHNSESCIYRQNGGELVVISGRPYRYDYQNMKYNISYLLGHVFEEGSSAVEENKEATVTQFALKQNYPNPFNPSTTIHIEVPSAAEVSLKIYNINGRLVASLLDNEMLGAGVHQVVWDGKDGRGCDVSAGMYFYRLCAGDYICTRKMIYLK